MKKITGKTTLRASVNLCIAILFTVIATHAQTWEPLAIPQLNSVAIDENYATVGYNDVVYVCSDLGLFASSDNGTTFSNLTFETGPTANLPIRSVFLDEENDILYAGGENAIFKSTDNGASWTATAATGLGFVNNFAMLDDTVVAVHGDNSGPAGVVSSTDAFATVMVGTLPSTAQMKDVLAYDNSFLVAGVEGIYKSTDGGATFSQIGTGYPTTGAKYWNIEQINTTLFAGDVFGTGLYESTDMGVTWANADPLNYNDFCQVFDAVTGSGALLTVQDGACNNGEPIKLSTDGGETFSSALYNLPNAFYDRLGVNSTETCFFVYARFKDTFYRICDLPLSVNEVAGTTITVYPSPTKGIVTIQGIQQATITAYNAFGVKVESFQNFDNGASINMAKYASGIYFLTIETQRGIQTFKVLKE